MKTSSSHRLGFPVKVENVEKKIAVPTSEGEEFPLGRSGDSATSASALGDDPKKASFRSAGVEGTVCPSFSYSASWQTRE